MLHVLPPTFKPVNNLICCKGRFDVGGKRATSLFNYFCSNVVKQVARFLLPVFPYLWEEQPGNNIITTKSHNVTTQLTNHVNNQSFIQSTDVIQLNLTLKMTTVQVRCGIASHCQTTVLLRTTLIRTIMLNLLMK